MVLEMQPLEASVYYRYADPRSSNLVAFKCHALDKGLLLEAWP